MRKVQLDLVDLPQSFADDPQAHLLSLCTSFLRDIDNYTNGKPTYPPGQRTFLRDAFKYYRILERDIKLTRPQFQVAPPVQPPSVALPISEMVEHESKNGILPT